MTTFLRRIYNRYHKLGKMKGKKRVWRKPKGRDNKMREKRRGYSPVVSVGYRQGKSERESLIIVRNFDELSKMKKGDRIILGNVGNRKKINLVKSAGEKGIVIVNVNTRKFLKKAVKEGVKK